ncbi:TlpA disulfide reductase family protein [Acidipila sp. EB88]|uniref:TlpA family protein disulfide reductase n=1 Tax=Acidipila sp. EB88 TaxID=2305226 RepID=UPI0013159AFE|nr:TlpA disulfide reductase family protein [Acidipila sp. EB88]
MLTGTYLPLIFSLALCASAAASSSNVVPEIALKDLSGQKQRLSALKGNIVVLNFWATWCGPCQEELPLLSRLHDAYAGKPVRFVAVSIDEGKSREQLAASLARHEVKLEVWAGATTETMSKVGLGDVVPSTLILDASGEVITRITGEARESDLRSRIDWLLTGRLGDAPGRTLDRSRETAPQPSQK